MVLNPIIHTPIENFHSTKVVHYFYHKILCTSARHRAHKLYIKLPIFKGQVKCYFQHLFWKIFPRSFSTHHLYHIPDIPPNRNCNLSFCFHAVIPPQKIKLWRLFSPHPKILQTITKHLFNAGVFTLFHFNYKDPKCQISTSHNSDTESQSLHKQIKSDTWHSLL